MSSFDLTRPVAGGPAGFRLNVLIGAVLLAAVAALVASGRPAPVAPLPDAAYSAPMVLEDWRGNSGVFRPAGN